MTYKELEEFFEITKDIPDQDARERAIVLLFKAQSEAEKTPQILQESKLIDDKNDIILKFTTKEISKMPKRFRKEIILNERVVKCRRRKSGKNGTNYELRYRRNGYTIAVSSNDFEKAKEKFIEALKNVALGVDENSIPTTFHEFAIYYFENFRKRKVAKLTYENDFGRYRNHIKPYYESIKIKEITPNACQRHIDVLSKKSTKTSVEVYSLLNVIFKAAIAHGLIEKNPLSMVLKPTHQTEHGVALTKDEEKKLLQGVKGTKYEYIFALALYTGLRPNELNTAKIEGQFIVAKNSKRKGGKIEYKRIPICTMLQPYLKGMKELQIPTLEYIRYSFNNILPNHILYDLRTTFYTRCEECGVAEPARDEFVGHSRGKLNSTYSDLSDEYLLSEGKKLVW